MNKAPTTREAPMTALVLRILIGIVLFLGNDRELLEQNPGFDKRRAGSRHSQVLSSH